MVFTLALLTNLLFAATALAIPASRSEARLARRANRQSRPMTRLGAATSSDSSYVEYGTNWAGAVWKENDGTFTTVTGTFNAPTLSGASGSGAAAWVGIDGFSCQNGLFQSGMEFTITNGEASYEAWYEWYPDPPNYFSGITISAGDQITVNVTASSTTSGTVVLENLTNGQSITQSVSSTYALCGQNAEWIVEDFEQNGDLIPFADFSLVTFTSASASGPSGTTYTPSGATVVDIKQNGKVLTSVSTSGDTVTINYV